MAPSWRAVSGVSKGGESQSWSRMAIERECDVNGLKRTVREVTRHVVSD